MRPGSSSPTSRPCTGARCCWGSCSSASTSRCARAASSTACAPRTRRSPFQWRRVWGAYFAAVGFNNVVPARGGDVIKLFLTRSLDPRLPLSDGRGGVLRRVDLRLLAWASLVLIFAFTQGVFPKPPDFSKLSSFDISYLAEHFHVTLFLITALGVFGVVAFALLADARQAFWAARAPRVTILGDRRRYLREVASLAGPRVAVRFVAFWFLLDAFRVGGSVRERPARVRRQPGRRRGAVHAWRRGRAAGAAAEGLRHERADPPSSPRTRSVSRSRSPRSRCSSGSARSSSSSASARSRRCCTRAAPHAKTSAGGAGGGLSSDDDRSVEAALRAGST